MPLPSPGATFDYSALVAKIVAPHRKGAITIFDPDDFTIDAPYSAVTDTGGVKIYRTVWSGPARIQQLRPTDSANKTEWGTKRGFHFDIDLAPDLPFLRQGLRIRVTNGGRDKALELLGFTIDSAVNSSSAAQRTIIAVTDGAEVPRV